MRSGGARTGWSRFLQRSQVRNYFVISTGLIALLLATWEAPAKHESAARDVSERPVFRGNRIRRSESRFWDSDADRSDTSPVSAQRRTLQPSARHHDFYVLAATANFSSFVVISFAFCRIRVWIFVDPTP
jgi:hypothetical protein